MKFPQFRAKKFADNDKQRKIQQVYGNKVFYVLRVSDDEFEINTGSDICPIQVGERYAVQCEEGKNAGQVCIFRITSVSAKDARPVFFKSLPIGACVCTWEFVTFVENEELLA